MYRSAVYGSAQAYYGNIQYGNASPQPVGYGAWEERNKSPFKKYERLGAAQAVPEAVAGHDSPMPLPPDPERVEAIATIKRLRAELAESVDTGKRQELRRGIEAAQREKELIFRKAAQRAAREDEEDAFLLLH